MVGYCCGKCESKSCCLCWIDTSMEIKGACSHSDARMLSAKSPVRAKVNDRMAIVDASAWEPTIGDQASPHFVSARLVQDLENDMQAKGTSVTDDETQQLIDNVNWQEWPKIT